MRRAVPIDVREEQVYIYGGLDTGSTEIARSFGMAWGIGGWLLPYFLERIRSAEAQKLRDRVVAELHTTFASAYTAEISLAQALDPKTVTAYCRRHRREVPNQSHQGQ